MKTMQAFVYETDDLRALETMLRAAAKSAFDDKPPGQYTALHINKARPCSFDDGIDYHFDEKPQVCPLGISGKLGLVLPERTYHGTTFLKVIGLHESQDEAAKAACDYHKAKAKPTKTRRWITTLAEYKSDMKEGDFVASSIDSLCCQAMQIASKAKEEQREDFLRECGSGYNVGFNSNDGDIDVGYRLERRLYGAWNHLDVSMVHIYYGK